MSVGVVVLFFRYVINFYRGIFSKFKFQVALAVGVRQGLGAAFDAGVWMLWCPLVIFL